VLMGQTTRKEIPHLSLYLERWGKQIPGEIREAEFKRVFSNLFEC